MLEGGWGCRGGAEDGVEFAAEACDGRWGGVQEVEGVGDGRRGRVVAGKDKGLDLVDGGGAEGRVHARGAGVGCCGSGGGGRGILVFCLVGLQGEVDDGAFAVGFWAKGAVGVAVGGGVAVGLGGGGGEALVEFFPNEAVELAAVDP